MKHNGVPRTLRRDIWRLANNQAFIFVDAESGIRSKVESKAGKSRMDRILGLIDVVQWLHQLRTFLQKQRCFANSNYRTLLQIKRQLGLQSTTWSPGSPLTVGRENLGTRLLCAKFVPTSISSTLYGLLFVICRHVPPTKGLRILGPTIEQTKAQIIKKYIVSP